jgi:hypothetical protein
LEYAEIQRPPQSSSNVIRQFVFYLTSALKLIPSNATNQGSSIHNDSLQKRICRSPYVVNLLRLPATASNFPNSVCVFKALLSNKIERGGDNEEDSCVYGLNMKSSLDISEGGQGKAGAKLNQKLVSS